MPYAYGTPSRAYAPRTRGYGSRPSALRSLFAYRSPDDQAGGPPELGSAPSTFTWPWGSTSTIDPHDTSFGQAPGDLPPRGTPYTAPTLPRSDQGEAPAKPAAPTTPQGPQGPLSWADDPILAQVKALNERLISQAQAAQLAGTKQAQIALGFLQGLQYADPATEQAARQNPFSALATLLLGHQRATKQIDDDDAKANLSYGGAHITHLSDEARNYTLGQSQAQAGYQDRINSLAQMVMDAENAAEERLLGARNTAYDRALQRMLAGGYGPGGGGAGGGGGGGGIGPGSTAGTSGADLWQGWYYPPGASEPQFGNVPAGYVFDGSYWHPPGWTPPPTTTPTTSSSTSGSSSAARPASRPIFQSE